MTQKVLTTKALCLIEERLSTLVPPREGPHKTLYEGARYSLLGGGKRLRPHLLLSVLEDYQVPYEKGLDVACAIEMIHTYSLIHDDLPCMDDDDLRRAKPSLHKVLGEGMAVLVGDFLLTYAFEVLSSFPSSILSLIARAAGAEGVIGGQVVDILHEGKEIDENAFNFMISGKTSALFRASLECGGILAGATPQDRERLRKGGEAFGIAFQIQDDLLDITSDEKTLGKPIGSALKNEKASAISLYGIEKAKKLIAEQFQRSLALLPNHCIHTLNFIRSFNKITECSSY
ncbi:MAG: polyprenyl synthetase family protein [Chlamydiia bacterium]|nr:polyprenyl synthetase family protein [Chlamydiia bacterium]